MCRSLLVAHLFFQISGPLLDEAMSDTQSRGDKAGNHSSLGRKTKSAITPSSSGKRELNRCKCLLEMNSIVGICKRLVMKFHQD